MTDNQAFKLIHIYLIISDLYDRDLKYYCQRFSNNNKPEFTDSELITIYLFAMTEHGHFNIAQIYKFAAEYLHSWFPKLPSYVAFNTRLNKLAPVFQRLTEIFVKNHINNVPRNNVSLLDSMPIITCSGKREAKVATEIIDKGYSSSKGFFYFGLKLHLLAFHSPNKLPVPESFVITQASENDLNVFREYWAEIQNRIFYGDKIYSYANNLFHKYNSIMLTPIKETKAKSTKLKQIDKAAHDLFNKAVSKVRQPIESFFNWLIQKTNIQKASNVRSTKGLIVHVFGKIAAALFIFNS